MSGAIIHTFDAPTQSARLTISNPGRRNALTPSMVLDLNTMIQEISHDDSVRSIVIRGEGDDLTSGSDAASVFAYYQDQPGGADGPVPSQRSRLFAHDQLWWGPEGLYHRLLFAPKLVIVEAKGYCYEAGLYLAMCADAIVAADTCRFANPRFRYVGADGDLSMLSLSFGLKRAKELIFLGRELSAEDAKDWGLLAGTMPLEELAGAVDRTAAGAMSLYRDGIAAGKYYLRAALSAMQVSTGLAFGTIMGGITSNMRHREGEFNFLREQRDHGTSAALRMGRAFYDAPLFHNE